MTALGTYPEVLVLFSSLEPASSSCFCSSPWNFHRYSLKYHTPRKPVSVYPIKNCTPQFLIHFPYFFFFQLSSFNPVNCTYSTIVNFCVSAALSSSSRGQGFLSISFNTISLYLERWQAHNKCLCYGMNVCAPPPPPQFLCWTPTPQYDSIRRWDL